jgi:C4-dicarboxylate transporter DctQ subunit
MPQRVVDRLEEGGIALLLAFMTIVTFTQVVLRYGFNAGFVWALEATTYAFLWLVLLGLSYGVRENAHIGVDALVKALPRPFRRAVGITALAACLAYVGLMLWGSLTLVQRLAVLGSNARDVPLPRWLLSLALPLGFGLLGFRLLQALQRVLRGERDMLGLGHEDGGDESLAAEPLRPEPRHTRAAEGAS